MDVYDNPEGYAGKGSDIKWCSRAHGGKRCMLCKHYASFETWSKDWCFYYLYSWNDTFWPEHPKMIGCYSYKYMMMRTPPHYRTPGLMKHDLALLLHKGCKEKRKCKCVSIIQRGNWYCPKCYEALEKMATHKREHIHDLMINITDELKSEMLILTLSGTL
ncbi:MAG: hypothetical protein WC523_05040 [Patescibacteria group bacterium]